MKMLAVDTSSKVASVAICEEEIILCEFTTNHKMTHAGQLLPMIEQGLKAVNLGVVDMDLFAVANGPGSFTGLRIGVTTVKTMAFALKKPMVCVNTLEALAYNIQPEKLMVCSMLDARNRQVFTALYKPVEGLYEIQGETMALDVSEMVRLVKEKNQEVVFLGDGALMHQDYLKQELGDRFHLANPQHRLQRAANVGSVAFLKYKAGEFTDGFGGLPFYLRKSQAEQEYDRKKG